MFYPNGSVKKGGRFYLIWLADSWPVRFAAITHRQLWSQDISKLSDELRLVITNESGQPTKRFSLLLSSHILRGLVRLYERKATLLLADFCKMSINVFKPVNKRHVERDRRPPRRLPQLPPAETVTEQEPEDEPRVEELLQNSGNVVTNVQDITLKEATIPEFRLSPSDNFGEENPDEALQHLLADRTIEMMLHEESGGQVSGLELTVDDNSRDKSRLGVEAPQMETVAAMDVTFLRKSAGDSLRPEFEKDIPMCMLPATDIPEIPDLPNLTLPTEPIHHEPQQPQVQEKEKSPTTKKLDPEVPVAEVPVEQPRVQEPIFEELEELEEEPVRQRRLIVDHEMQLSNQLITPNVEMRCELLQETDQPRRTRQSALEKNVEVEENPVPTNQDLTTRSTEGLAQTTVVTKELRVSIEPLNITEAINKYKLTMPCHESDRQDQRFQPNVEVPRHEDIADLPTQSQETLSQLAKKRTTGEGIDESSTTRTIEPQEASVATLATEGPGQSTETSVVTNVDARDVNVPTHADIADLPTQKQETLSQIAKKRRTGECDDESPPKRVRPGYKSFKESQHQRAYQEPPQVAISEPEVEEEIVHPNILEPEVQLSASVSQISLDHTQLQVARRLLEEVGLSDLQQHSQPQVEPQAQTQGTKEASEGSSETPLGSLDRTQVSLGDSDKTTDDQRFVRKHWGPEGTMMKILQGISSHGAVTMESLVERGPHLPGQKRIIAALCFTSILKLKQHGFVRVVKNPDTFQIRYIMLGLRFDNI